MQNKYGGVTPSPSACYKDVSRKTAEDSLSLGKETCVCVSYTGEEKRQKNGGRNLKCGGGEEIKINFTFGARDLKFII